ncbi:MAG: dephospho-CoA kinase [Candidatus Brocadiales bacterium]
MHKVKIIGITGGIGSGKSTVAKMFASFGGRVIDADTIAHTVLSYQEVKDRIFKRWGKSVFNKHGEVDRNLLAKFAFSAKEQIDELNEIIHPIVIDYIKGQIEEIGGGGNVRAIIIDAALLVESDLANLCDIILFVDTTKQTRQGRVKHGRSWEGAELTRRERFQQSPSLKKKSADYVIDNNLSKENTISQVTAFWQRFILSQ